MAARFIIGQYTVNWLAADKLLKITRSACLRVWQDAFNEEPGLVYIQYIQLSKKTVRRMMPGLEINTGPLFPVKKQV